MTLTLKYRQFLLNRLFANMPAAAREAYDHANAVFASEETRILPAEVTIRTAVEVNRPDTPIPEKAKAIIDKAHHNLVVDQFVKAARKVRGLD